VLDSLFHESRATLDVPVALVEGEGVGLGVERDAAGSVRPSNAIGFSENGAAHASAALLALHCQAAEPRHTATEEESTGADHAPVLHRDEVGGLGIAAVPVGLQRYPLLAAEYALAQLQRRFELLVCAYRPDLQDQRA
jgi:hypothetical protein